MAVSRTILLLITVSVVTGNPFKEDGPRESAKLHVRQKRQAVEERPGCQSGATTPETRIDTTARLAAMRNLFSSVDGGPIHAYIVPSGDAHLSEYTSDYDGRRGYITGFTGSYGTAVVTTNRAALWTDARYFQEAEGTLDCNWILMKDMIPGTPSIVEWLTQELSSTANPRVGLHPFFMDAGTWESYSNDFSKERIALVPIATDLVDRIWTSGRPAQPNTPINMLPMEYAGRSWQDKVGDARARINDTAKTYIITTLDETAWLFNLRASDVNYTPFFISYAIVEMDRVRLYILNHNTKLTRNPTDPASTSKLYEHLNTGMDGACTGKTGLCVEVLPYVPSDILNDVSAIATTKPNEKIWVTLDCNQAIYGSIPENQRVYDKSPLALMKSIKNEVEQRGMKNAYLRDAVALISFIERLEREVKAGVHWTEVSASMELKKYRAAQDLNRGLSFAAIAGSGSNAALMHYRPTNATDKQITTTDCFLLDSGGQYLDGTIDVTRTFFFGTPSEYFKECYTRVLQGHIDLARLRWPKGLYGREVDIIARTYLWEAGLRYLHGTGHGVGSYLSVHDYPPYIGRKGYLIKNNQPLTEHMYLSNEPGYYEDGKFGIRLETIVSVERADTQYSVDDTVFLEFRPVSLVPYEPHLIRFHMLTRAQKKWLVDFHKQVMDEVYPLLSVPAQHWVRSRYDQFVMHMEERANPTSGSTNKGACPGLLVGVISCLLLLFTY